MKFFRLQEILLYTNNLEKEIGTISRKKSIAFETKREKKRKKKYLDTVEELSIFVFGFNSVHGRVVHLIPASQKLHKKDDLQLKIKQN